MRPGKPLIFGALERNGERTPFLGLPGNPVSALVCALMFMAPVMQRMLGRPADGPPTEAAVLGADLAANDEREDYLRATLSADAARPAGRDAVRQAGQLDALAPGRGRCADRPPRPRAACVGPATALILFRCRKTWP